jgi:hypothetical protein
MLCERYAMPRCYQTLQRLLHARGGLVYSMRMSTSVIRNNLFKPWWRAVSLYAFLCLFAVACSESTQPPYIKAQVIDVYNNKTDIIDAHFLYWWQERGETAFLATHTRRDKVLYTNKAVPADGTAASGAIIPVRRHLTDISKIEWVVTATGKKMYVYGADGIPLETVCTFPQEFHVNPQSGLADYKRYITGRTQQRSRGFDFKQDLDFVRTILITGIETQRQ